MFATFNLQLMPNASLDTAGDSPVTMGLPAGETPEGSTPEFAGLLRFQLGSGESGSLPGGETLPPGGNILPSLDASITSESAIVEWQTPLNASDEPVSAADSLLPGWIPVLPTSDGKTLAAAESRSNSMNSTEDVSAFTNLRSGSLPELQRVTIEGQNVELAVRTNQGPAQPNAAMVPILSNQPREILPTERTRTAGEIPLGSPEGTEGLRSAALPDIDRVPRVMATPEVAVVPDRANPATPVVSTTALASAINQVTGTAGRDVAAADFLSTDLVRTPVTDPAWGDRIGQRVVMMAGNQLQQAEIRLTPAELGPVRVQIAVEDGATNITFQAQHAVTREAIEAALPRLREMLADSGLSLGQANVNGDSVAEGQRDRRESASRSPEVDSDAELVDESQPERQKSVTSDGLIDTFV